MRSPAYKSGDPLGLHNVLHDWLKERALPAEIVWRADTSSWYLCGSTYLTAEIDGPHIIGWQPGFNLHAAEPDFFEQLEAAILDAEKERP